MTQQPLITRLKAVEEALAEVVRIGDRATVEWDNAKAALSDLRELIKEAEGQNKLSPLAFSWGDEDDIQAGE